jgi:hypothetical protein
MFKLNKNLYYFNRRNFGDSPFLCGSFFAIFLKKTHEALDEISRFLYINIMEPCKMFLENFSFSVLALGQILTQTRNTKHETRNTKHENFTAHILSLSTT